MTLLVVILCGKSEFHIPEAFRERKRRKFDINSCQFSVNNHLFPYSENVFMLRDIGAQLRGVRSPIYAVGPNFYYGEDPKLRGWSNFSKIFEKNIRGDPYV